MYGKGFLGNMTENLQADCVQSRQAGFMQCFLNYSTFCRFVQGIEIHAAPNRPKFFCFIYRQPPTFLVYYRKHCIKLVRKMRRQIFRQIAQKFRRQTVCLARDFWAI